MPTSKSKRESTLDVLREFYTFKDTIQNHDGSSSVYDHAEQVKEMVKTIGELQLNKNIETWGNTLSALRKEKGYTYQDLAEILNVTHRTVQKQEKTKDIDLFYLEAYSLIYGRSPFSLLKVEIPDELIEAETAEERFRKRQKYANHALSDANDQFVKYYNIILGSLYDETSPEKIDRLKVVTKVGKLNAFNYLTLLTSFKKFQFSSRIVSIEPDSSPEANNDSWRSVWRQLCPLTNEQRYTARHEQLAAFWDAHCLLEDLRDRKPTRMKVLAQLALADKPIMDYLKALLLGIGYPANPRGIPDYDIDVYIFKDHKKNSGKK